jgi:CheY-like chemotaxis protein
MPETLNATKSILVVDDNPIHRGLVEQELKRRFTLTLAADRDTATSRVAEKVDPFDLVILDSSIPQKEGDEPTREESLLLLGELRRSYQAPVILVVSGPVNDRLRANFERLGVVEIFEKPFSLVELGECVNKLLG